MKKFRELSEAIKDKFDIGEYDQEGDMAKSDLRSILANAKRVHDMLEDDDNLPEWVQSKITKAEDYMSTVANYLEAEMNEEVGASKKQETTFHKKLDTLVHKTFGKRKEEMKEDVKMPKQTRAEKEYRKITGKTVDQRLSELDKVQKDLAKQREDYIKQGIIKAEEVEIVEGIGGSIAGGIGQFIGNKIDPLHGEIMRAHGEVAGRAAEYTIRKHLNKLHSALKKHLSSGTVSEEVEELDEGKYGAFRTGPKRPKYPYVPQGDKDPRTGLPLGFSEPKKVKEEVEQIDEGLGKAKTFKKNGDMLNYHKHMEKHYGKLAAKVFIKNNYKENSEFHTHNNMAIKHYRAYHDLKDKIKEEVESLEEKNVPTSPEKWAQAKAQAKAKFDVYPSAYANGWAAKKYKEMGGGWKSVSEETDLDEGYFKNQEIERQETERLAKRNELPFTPDKPKKRSVVVGKKPEGYSRVRQLARQGMQKYIKPVKEEKEMSKKAKIVKGIMKKDKFESNPIISKTVDDKQS